MGKDVICIKGYIINKKNDCDENCEMQVGLGYGDCYSECLVCGEDNIQTSEGLICSICGNSVVDI